MILPVHARIEAVRNFVNELPNPDGIHITVIPTCEAYEAFVKEPCLNCMVTTRKAIDVAQVANGLRQMSHLNTPIPKKIF